MARKSCITGRHNLAFGGTALGRAYHPPLADLRQTGRIFTRRSLQIGTAGVANLARVTALLDHRTPRRDHLIKSGAGIAGVENPVPRRIDNLGHHGRGRALANDADPIGQGRSAGAVGLDAGAGLTNGGRDDLPRLRLSEQHRACQKRQKDA